MLTIYSLKNKDIHYKIIAVYKRIAVNQDFHLVSARYTSVLGTEAKIHFTAVTVSAFFTNVYLILKTSNCLEAGSKNINASGAVTHNSK